MRIRSSSTSEGRREYERAAAEPKPSFSFSLSLTSITLVIVPYPRTMGGAVGKLLWPAPTLLLPPVFGNRASYHFQSRQEVGTLSVLMSQRLHSI
mgnify:CR=1 FL=1